MNGSRGVVTASVSSTGGATTASARLVETSGHDTHLDRVRTGAGDFEVRGNDGRGTSRQSQPVVVRPETPRGPK